MASVASVAFESVWKESGVQQQISVSLVPQVRQLVERVVNAYLTGPGITLLKIEAVPEISANPDLPGVEISYSKDGQTGSIQVNLDAEAGVLRTIPASVNF